MVVARWPILVVSASASDFLFLGGIEAAKSLNPTPLELFLWWVESRDDTGKFPEKNNPEEMVYARGSV